MATNIDPALLARIFAANGQSVDGYFAGRGHAIMQGEGDLQQPVGYQQQIYRTLNDPTWGTARWETWNPDGSYAGYGSGDSDLRGLAKAAAAAAAMYFGATGLEGAGGGGAAGAAEGAAGAGGATGAGGAGSSSWLAAVPGEAAAPIAMEAGMTTIAPVTATGGATSGLLNSAAQSAASQAAQRGGSSSAAGGNSLPGGDMTRGLLTGAGAIAGALDSRDQTQTTTQQREPWAPTQEWLKQLIGQGQSLGQQYMANPISQRQRGLLDSSYGLLDQTQQMYPGLLDAARALGRRG